MTSTSKKEIDEKTFVPHGAMAFFVVVLAIMIAIWFFMYFVMIKRA